jgi:hypothetical protein
VLRLGRKAAPILMAHRVIAFVVGEQGFESDGVTDFEVT